MEYLKYYLIGINIISFLAYFIDKKRAMAKKSRISENSLIFLSFVGGSVGANLGMHLNHHKTKKFKFLILNTLFLVAHLVLLFFILQSYK